MPIYAYRCDACGHQKDVLQKMSDPTLTVCPSCGAESFARQLSAPAFQLKGTGWYVTDFRENGKKSGDAAKSSSDGNGNDDKAGDRAGDKPDGKSEAKSADAKPADAGGTGSVSPVAPAPAPVKQAASPSAPAGGPGAG
jgi:putative FmdB family regulatory protein